VGRHSTSTHLHLYAPASQGLPEHPAEWGILSFDDQLARGVPVVVDRSKRQGTLTAPVISGRVPRNSEAIAIDGFSGAVVVSLGPSRRIGSSGV
jgi:hypothetical protein